MSTPDDVVRRLRQVNEPLAVESMALIGDAIRTITALKAELAQRTISHYCDECGQWRFAVNPADKEKWLCERAHGNPACRPTDCTWPQCMHVSRDTAASRIVQRLRDIESQHFGSKALLEAADLIATQSAEIAALRAEKETLFTLSAEGSELNALLRAERDALRSAVLSYLSALDDAEDPTVVGSTCALIRAESILRAALQPKETKDG